MEQTETDEALFAAMFSEAGLHQQEIEELLAERREHLEAGDWETLQ